MEPKEKRLSDIIPPVHRIIPLPALALASVIAKDGKSVYASSDVLFNEAVFGRDSLEVADDLYQLKPGLVRNILLNMGELQGTVDNPISEESPGKIIHEYRKKVINGKSLKGRSLSIFNDLSGKWGGNDEEMAYYGSVDSTPFFVSVLHKFYLQQGPGVLREEVTQRNGKVVTLQDVARGAIQWIEHELAVSQSGLLEYKKRNPHGISNQVWKDSEEFYVHESGEMANHEAPIASIEVQGLTYDALQAAAVFIPENSGEYRQLASDLRDRTINLLWQPDRRYFALGLDHGPTGNGRIIHTSTANPAALMDTAFFDELELSKRQEYVEGIVRKIMSKDFLNNAGIRSRSLAAADLVAMWDYHGSFVTWPKETYDIAKGLRRQGFPRLAVQLENRLINLVLKTREYPEFVYVDEHGRLLTGKPIKHTHGEYVLVEGTNTPERLQAWTASALYAILASRSPLAKLGRKRQYQDEWARKLETEMLARTPSVKVHANPIKLWMNYQTHQYRLNEK